MYLLKEEQIARVTKDVENEGINFSHLSTDLIDHVCCDIEQQMNEGISFDAAYNVVKKEFGIRGLRHIQQDTLMLIDKNYRIMKKSMKMIGVIALAVMALAALFKIMHWPFAGPMLVLSFALVAFLFLPTLLYVVYKEVNKKKQASIYVIGYISGAAFMIGILAKIMHWPGGGVLFFAGLSLITYVLIPFIIVMRIKRIKMSKVTFLVGLLSLMIVLTGMFFKIMHWPGGATAIGLGSSFLVLVFMPLFYSKEVRKAGKIRVDFLFGIIAFTYFVVFSFLMNFKEKTAISFYDLKQQYHSYYEQTDYLAIKNNALSKAINSEEINDFSTKALHLCNQLEDIKIRIVQDAVNCNREDARAFLVHEVATINDVKYAVEFLFSSQNTDSPFPQLKSDLNDFGKMYMALLPDSTENNNAVSSLLSTEDRYVAYLDRMIPWEYYHFGGLPADEALNTLILLQYNIRLAESVVLSKQLKLKSE